MSETGRTVQSLARLGQREYIDRADSDSGAAWSRPEQRPWRSLAAFLNKRRSGEIISFYRETTLLASHPISKEKPQMASNDLFMSMLPMLQQSIAQVPQQVRGDISQVLGPIQTATATIERKLERLEERLSQLAGAVDSMAEQMKRAAQHEERSGAQLGKLFQLAQSGKEIGAAEIMGLLGGGE